MFVITSYSIHYTKLYEITVPLPAYVDSFSGVGLRNGNTGRELRVRSARVYDPTETAGLRPKNPVQTAGDAVVVMDGIEVTRPGNAISDLVPGLTVNLWQASDDPVKLKVEPRITSYNVCYTKLLRIGAANRAYLAACSAMPCATSTQAFASPSGAQ